MDPTADDPAKSRAYCLVVLTGVAALNQLDRQLMSILLEPVRREFALSDIQLGLLSGLAFAALYTTLSIPAAVWAVNHSRRNLITAAAVVWGAMTALCGAAHSFAQLFLARLGVGVGEAGGIPPSHAMISDLYRPGERATAMAIWASGSNIGILLAFMFGGMVAQRTAGAPPSSWPASRPCCSPCWCASRCASRHAASTQARSRQARRTMCASRCSACGAIA
jgi:MFS family permease